MPVQTRVYQLPCGKWVASGNAPELGYGHYSVHATRLAAVSALENWLEEIG